MKSNILTICTYVVIIVILFYNAYSNTNTGITAIKNKQILQRNESILRDVQALLNQVEFKKCPTLI